MNGPECTDRSPVLTDRAGLSLVEVLVVVAIIGALVALLLPAVQSSRDAARRTACQANLQQLCLACTQHEGVHGHLPSGGWGYLWIGDPKMGFGTSQPGGWAYSILPYLEHEMTHQLPANRTGQAKLDASAVLRQTVIPEFFCPSRRRARLYPTEEPCINAADVNAVAKTDYAANGGSRVTLSSGPTELACLTAYPECDWTHTDSWLADNFDGVCGERSQVRSPQITDGLSRTLLVAEKYVNASEYDSVNDRADNSCVYQGADWDNLRWANRLDTPRRDAAAVFADHSFGSSHASGFYAAMCDGAVRFLDYQIDSDVYEALGTRADQDL